VRQAVDVLHRPALHAQPAAARAHRVDRGQAADVERLRRQRATQATEHDGRLAVAFAQCVLVAEQRLEFRVGDLVEPVVDQQEATFGLVRAPFDRRGRVGGVVVGGVARDRQQAHAVVGVVGAVERGARLQHRARQQAFEGAGASGTRAVEACGIVAAGAARARHPVVLVAAQAGGRLHVVERGLEVAREHRLDARARTGGRGRGGPVRRRPVAAGQQATRQRPGHQPPQHRHAVHRRSRRKGWTTTSPLPGMVIRSSSRLPSQR
jgi:hypothetical protein